MAVNAESYLPPIWYLLPLSQPRTMRKICSKLTLKTLERHQQRLFICRRHRSGIFIVNFEQILHIFLVFQLLTLNK